MYRQPLQYYESSILSPDRGTDYPPDRASLTLMWKFVLSRAGQGRYEEIRKIVETGRPCPCDHLTNEAANLTEYLARKRDLKAPLPATRIFKTIEEAADYPRTPPGDSMSLSGPTCLREGLDIPEVGFIEDPGTADKEVSSETKEALSNIIGRAARKTQARRLYCMPTMTVFHRKSR